jgi:hypothetical protein
VQKMSGEVNRSECLGRSGFAQPRVALAFVYIFWEVGFELKLNEGKF